MRLTAKVLMVLAVMLIIIIIPVVILIWQNQQASIIQQARIRALTLHQMIVVTRQWVATNRDRIEPVPAQATKELSQYANYMADFRFHIASDKLINPENAPTEFEERAIAAFLKGGTEYWERDVTEEFGRVYRYAAPLLINESCLPCHSHQGYELDDFRGLISVQIPLEDLEQAVRSSNITLIVSFVLGLVMAILVLSQLMYRLVLSPIGALTEATVKIRAGDYTFTTKLKTNDEIQELSEAFDMMSEQIARNEDNLKARLQEAVQNYVDTVEELKEKNIELDTLNQLKTDLLDSIAHEIRTPITKILSYSELLTDTRIADEPNKAKFAKLLKRNIQSLTSMFNDIITMSRLEHGQYEYHRIPLALRELVGKIVENYEREIGSKGLLLRIEISKDFRIIVDGESFQDVMNNIISNAVKYSYENTEILIKAWREGEDVVISCRDEGVGIPETDLPHVFGRFQRGANVKNEYTGTGLGLAIVERVVTGHGGSLSVISVLGKYTEITVRLPIFTDDL